MGTRRWHQFTTRLLIQVSKKQVPKCTLSSPGDYDSFVWLQKWAIPGAPEVTRTEGFEVLCNKHWNSEQGSRLSKLLFRTEGGGVSLTQIVPTYRDSKKHNCDSFSVYLWPCRRLAALFASSGSGWTSTPGRWWCQLAQTPCHSDHQELYWSQNGDTFLSCMRNNTHPVTCPHDLSLWRTSRTRVGSLEVRLASFCGCCQTSYK